MAADGEWSLSPGTHVASVGRFGRSRLREVLPGKYSPWAQRINRGAGATLSRHSNTMPGRHLPRATLSLA